MNDRMSRAQVPLLALACAGIIAAALLWHSGGNRYELGSLGTGVLVRLDRRTGEIAACFPRSARDEDGQLITIVCNGRPRDSD